MCKQSICLSGVLVAAIGGAPSSPTGSETAGNSGVVLAANRRRELGWC